jgi:histidinol-phosphate/aromatic aminotransferase/cobyric acid decarboxylase-like protein
MQEEARVVGKTYHGGAFWDAIGADFAALDRRDDVISADVLDAWFNPSPKVVAKIAEFLPFALKTSPPTQCEGLIAAIAETRGVPRRHILVGGGSSDLMFAIFPHLLQRDDRVLILDPMYGEYAHILEHVIGLQPIRHPLAMDAGFAVDYDRLRSHLVSTTPSLVIIVNPNSPTGQYWESDRIERLAEEFPETTFVVDETYMAYIEGDHSLERATTTHRNLVVLTSMSKVYALSGARVGYLIGHPDILNRVGRFIPPWSVSLLGQIAGTEALRDPDYYRSKYAETRRLRADMEAQLAHLPVEVFPSACNFLLVRLCHRSAATVVGQLRRQRIYLRNCDSMSTQFHDDFIRIAVKDPAANQRILNAFRQALA